MIRQFRIQGIDTGVSYSLNDFNKYLLTLPQGLGFEFKNNFLKVGNQRVLVDKEYQFKEINGTIEVCGDTRLDWEKNYNELRSFIASNKTSGFKLFYKPTEENEKYIICNIRLLTKTEKTTYGILVPIALEPRTLWEQDYSISSSIVGNLGEDDENIVAFLQREDGSYNYGFLKEAQTDEYNAVYLKGIIGEIELINDGDDEIPLKIIINSACVNPFITLKDNSGKVISSSKVFVVINEGDILTLDSNPETLSILMVRSSGVVENVINQIDFSRQTFLTLPVGSYTMEITDENGNYVNTIVEISKRYLGG